MPITHLLLTLFVIVIWGINFIFLKLGLLEVSPLLLCACRFFFASVPAVFFIKRPPVAFKYIAAYGLIMFAMQFTLVFCGLKLGMTPGMASLIMQLQVFFSLFFAAFILKEPLNPGQLFGALLAFLGITIIAKHFDHEVTLAGFLCIMGAAAAWG